MTAREVGFLFSDPMVRALLARQKTRTRRIVEPPKPPGSMRKPRAAKGDTVVVRESIGLIHDGLHTERLVYRATYEGLMQPERWRPPFLMPRFACRLLLEVEDVCTERLQAITNDEAVAEGIVHATEPAHADPPSGAKWFLPRSPKDLSPRAMFATGWDAINDEDGKRWADNPWVWVYSLRETWRQE